MFEVDPARVWVDPTEGPVSSLIQSLNTPLVAAGSHPAENVQSWIVARQSPGGGAFDVFVYFHLTQTNQSVVYRWDGGAVPPPQLEYVQEEAMSFCESMGFMMDDLQFSSLDRAKKDELIATLPPFAQDLGALAPVVAGEAEQVVKTVDPVADFARARQAMQEAGQLSTSEFAAAQGQNETSGEDILAAVAAFDPASAPPPQDLGGEEMQIEITEVEGLDLIPAEEVLSPASAEPSISIEEEPSEPPLVTGRIAMPPREKTPADSMEILDLESFGASPQPLPVGMGGANDEISIDDVLADVGNGAGNGSQDLSTQLDDILDGVESSRGSPPAQPEPPLVVGKPAAVENEFDLSIDIEGGLGDFGAAPEPKPAAMLADKTEVLSIDNILGEPEPSPAPPKPKQPAAPPPVPIPALDAAWGTDGGAPAPRPSSNGKGAHAPALDIATDDLARLLAML